MGLPSPTAESRAVVTGASSGIGTALAAELARRGHSLILVARRGEILDALADRLTREHGITAEARAVDLADRTLRSPRNSRAATSRSCATTRVSRRSDPCPPSIPPTNATSWS
jgi:short-subunit dehydrogenase